MSCYAEICFLITSPVSTIRGPGPRQLELRCIVEPSNLPKDKWVYRSELFLYLMKVV